MSHSYKDKANHFLHHKKPNSPYMANKEKHKYEEKDIPAEVKKLVKTLELSNKGLRSGNQRKDLAKQKVLERKKDRKATKAETINILKNEL